MKAFKNIKPHYYSPLKFYLFSSENIMVCSQNYWVLSLIFDTHVHFRCTNLKNAITPWLAGTGQTASSAFEKHGLESLIIDIAASAEGLSDGSSEVA